MGEHSFARSSTMKVIILAVMVSMVMGANVPVEPEAEAVLPVQPEVREVQMSEKEYGRLVKELYGEENAADAKNYNQGNAVCCAGYTCRQCGHNPSPPVYPNPPTYHNPPSNYGYGYGRK